MPYLYSVLRLFALQYYHDEHKAPQNEFKGRLNGI